MSTHVRSSISLIHYNRKPSDSAASRDTEALILDTVKSAVRFQKNVGDAWIKVCKLNVYLIPHSVRDKIQVMVTYEPRHEISNNLTF